MDSARRTQPMKAQSRGSVEVAAYVDPTRILPRANVISTRRLDAKKTVEPIEDEQNPHSGPDLLFKQHRLIRRALRDSIQRWEQVPVRGRWLANSHPKSGTHLVRNILLHFNNPAVHRQFLFPRNFAEGWHSGKTPGIHISHIS